MPDLTPERLAELRALAEATSATEWLPSDLLDDLFTLEGPNVRYVAALSPDVVTALLDEIERLRDKLNETESILSFLVHDHQKIEAVRTLLNAEVVWVGDKEDTDA